MVKSLRWREIPDNLKGRIIDQSGSIPSNQVKEPKEAKYHNVKNEYQGIQFDSLKETAYYKKLLILQKYGEVVKIELQPEYPYIITYCLPLPSDQGNNLIQKVKYIADFLVTYADGHVEIADVKGIKTAIYRRKKRIVEKLYSLKITEI